MSMSSSSGSDIYVPPDSEMYSLKQEVSQPHSARYSSQEAHLVPSTLSHELLKL